MKLNFKTLLIVFLVAMLGAMVGTFGIEEYYSRNNRIDHSIGPIVSEVQYTDIQNTDYTVAIEKAYGSVVEITVTYEAASYNWFIGNQKSKVTAKGSGVIISHDGYIVTNNHVIENATGDNDIEIKLADGSTTMAKLVGKDSRSDIAVLKIEGNDYQYSLFADSNELLLGQSVIAIGNPLGDGITCSDGIISALSKEIYINNVYMTVLQTNAAINEGNSGGGLFDLNGNLVGVVNAKDGSSSYSSVSVEGMGYAIPSNTAKYIIDELINNGYVKDRAALGISVYSSDYYVSSTKGVIVASVIEGGGADVAGIKEGDAIIAINDVEINSYADLSKFLDSKLVGDIVSVTILRNEEKLTVDVVLQQSVNNN